MIAPPTCPLPGCTNETTAPGTPCHECLDAFGSYLAPAPTRAIPLTAEQITAELAARDRGTADAYALQAATEAAAATSTAQPSDEADVLLLTSRGVDPTSPVAAVLATADAKERKPNQRCWLCEQRRTCTREPMGWECDTCQQIDGTTPPEGHRS